MEEIYNKKLEENGIDVYIDDNKDVVIRINEMNDGMNVYFVEVRKNNKEIDIKLYNDRYVVKEIYKSKVK